MLMMMGCGGVPILVSTLKEVKKNLTFSILFECK